MRSGAYDINRYKKLHLYMIIPFVLMQSGFIENYWLQFKTEQWVRHIHALSAMCWYTLLIVQPYFATHGKMKYHRTWGIVGFFVAGATAFTAISLLPQDVEFGDKGGFDAPFTADFFYGVVFVELLMMVAFVVAVIMSIVKRKNVNEHSLWLVTTVFYIMMPGLGRGIAAPVFKYIGPDNWLAISLSAVIIIAALFFIGYKLRQLCHPAIVLGIAVNVPTFFVYWLGRQQWYVEWLQHFMVYKIN